MPEPARARIHIIHREKATGMEAASNAALAQTQGDYVAIHDDDDSWDPKFLERCVEFLDAHPDHVGVAVRCDVIKENINDDGTITEVAREILDADRSWWTLTDTLVASYSPPIAQVVRKDLAIKLGGWNECMKTQGDWDFSIRLLAQGPAGFIDGEPLAHWHHRQSATGNLGNSIFVASDDHVSANLLARDRYIRDAIKVDEATSKLGEVVQVAEYYKRLNEALHQQVDSLHTALYQAHADLRQIIEKSTVQIEQLRQEVTNLHEDLRELASRKTPTQDFIDRAKAKVGIQSRE